jgi:hypothetical protein
MDNIMDLDTALFLVDRVGTIIIWIVLALNYKNIEKEVSK